MPNLWEQFSEQEMSRIYPRASDEDKSDMLREGVRKREQEEKDRLNDSRIDPLYPEA